MTDTVTQKDVRRSARCEKSNEETIASRFEQQAAAFPDKLAVVTDARSLTYGTLDVQAGSIAAGLASVPSDNSRPVVIFVSGEMACVAAMLGALKANRIFIPLAPSSPEGWVGQVTKDSGSAQIIADTATRAIAKRAAPNDVTVLEFEQLVNSGNKVVTARSSHTDDPAYVVYTS